LLRRQRRAGATHVGLHPTRMHAEHADALRGERRGELARGHVQGRLADRVARRAEAAHAGDRAELRRQVHHFCIFPFVQKWRERLRQQYGAGHVAREGVAQRLGGERAEALARNQHAGVVDQHVERVGERADFAHELGDRALLVQVERQHVQVPRMRAGLLGQRECLAGVAAGGVHPVAAREQLAREFQPQTAVGAGDENACHASPPCLNFFSLARIQRGLSARTDFLREEEQNTQKKRITNTTG